MNKVDNYKLSEVISFQNNEILKFWAFDFVWNTDSDTGEWLSILIEYWYWTSIIW